LTFCAVNGLTVMNTCMKRGISTSIHGNIRVASWHCIDYVLMRQSQRSFCRDVLVVRRADCWTDHKLLHAKITLRHKPLVARQHLRRCFAGYKLRDRSVGVAFNDEVVKRISSVWSDDVSFEEKWSTIRDGFVAGAEAVLGEDCRRLV